MQWFRLHNKLLNDPVVQTLSDKNFKIYINLLCLASIEDKDGDIGTLNSISFALRETKEDVSSCFIALQEAGLIVTSVTDSETFQIPQWKKKQYKSDTSTDRVKKHREKVKRSKTVTVTPPDTDSDTEQKQINTSDQRSLSVVKKIPKKSKNLVLKDFTDAGINQEIAEDFIQHRKNLKAPVTRTAMKAICTEANKANLPIETVLAEIQNRGWRGFKAEWIQENDRKCFAQINDEYQKEKAKERYATLLSATEEELSEWGLQ